jgi:hypothetical protein
LEQSLNPASDTKLIVSSFNPLKDKIDFLHTMFQAEAAQNDTIETVVSPKIQCIHGQQGFEGIRVYRILANS